MILELNETKLGEVYTHFGLRHEGNFQATKWRGEHEQSLVGALN